MHLFPLSHPAARDAVGKGKKVERLTGRILRILEVTTISLEFRHFLLQTPGLIKNQVSICLV